MSAAAADAPKVATLARPARADTRPFSPFEWMIALRYLRSRRWPYAPSAIAFFSILGIAVGVMVLIAVMSVMNGFRKELLDKIIGVNGHIFLQAAETPLTDYLAVTDRVSKIQGVTLALPMIEGQALASSPYQSAGVLVRGAREADIKRVPGVGSNIRLGTLDGFDESGGVAIGQRLADHLSLRIGDQLTLVSPKGAQTPFGTAPRIKSYPVVAIFQIGMSEFDATFVYMPLEEAQLYFNKEGEASVIEVFVDEPDKMDAMRDRIDALALRPMIMTDWRQRNRTFFDALKVERTVMFTILTLIVVVAALNILSGLIMLVKDKVADIAILRTIGATKGAVMRVFLLAGAAMGMIGAVIGVLLGIALAANLEAIRAFINRVFTANLFPSELYFLSRLPSVIDPRDVVAVVVLTLALALLATLYPSWRAARLDPVEALRYQ